MENKQMTRQSCSSAFGIDAKDPIHRRAMDTHCEDLTY
jgi:hypothetical protein